MDFTVLYRSIFDLVRDPPRHDAYNQQDRALRRYLTPDLLLIDDMGMRALPKKLRGVALGNHHAPVRESFHVLAAGAVLDRFLHQATITTITGKSHRLKD